MEYNNFYYGPGLTDEEVQRLNQGLKVPYVPQCSLEGPESRGPFAGERRIGVPIDTPKTL